MEKIKVGDRWFTPFISETDILKRVEEVAASLNKDYAGKKPVFLVVLNGAFMFASDLMKRINIPCEITFIKLSSYEGMNSTGKIKEVMGLYEDIRDRHVVIVEDIVDTGLTMQRVMEILHKHHPASVEMCTLLFKPDKLVVDSLPKYVAFSIPNAFVLGYGLDYEQEARNLRNIYTIVE